MEKSSKSHRHPISNELLGVLAQEEQAVLDEFTRGEQELRAELEGAEGELAARAQKLLADLEEARMDFMERINALRHS